MRPSEILQAINTMVVGLKADGVWEKITEFYLLCGHTFPAITVKLKGTGSLTNIGPFVTGDYVAVGSGAGLAKNGIKTLGTSLPFSGLDITDIAFGAYRTEAESTATTHTHFNFTSTTRSLTMVQVSSVIQFRFGTESISVSADGNSGFLVGTRNAATIEAYRNGASQNTTGGASGSLPDGSLTLFNLGTNYRDSLVFLGTGLTDTEATNLSTRVNVFMTALGANVY